MLVVFPNHRMEQQESAVKHINLDGQDEAIKNFFLTLAVDPEGSVVELNGRPVAHLVPVPPAGQGNGSGKWTEEKNARRCALIDKEIDGKLSAGEARELAELQAEMLRHRHRVAPLPLDDARRLHQELLAKAQQSQDPA